MHHHRVLGLVMAFTLVGTACAGSDESGDSNGSEPEGDPSTTETAAFRTVVSEDGDLIVRVPADDETDVSIEVLDPSEWPEFLAGAEETPGVTVYDLQPTGATFEEPVHVFRKVEIADLDLDDLAPLDIPVAYLFTTDEQGAPELMRDPRLLRTPDAVWVGGATDHFSPAGTVNQQTALSTDDVFRQLLSSVTDTEGERVIDVEPFVPDPPEVPGGEPPPLMTTGPDARSHWLTPLTGDLFRVQGEVEEHLDAAADAAADDAATAFDNALAAMEEAGATLTDPAVLSADVQVGDIVFRASQTPLGVIEWSLEVDPGSIFAPPPVFPTGNGLTLHAGIPIHSQPTEEFTQGYLALLADRYGQSPPSGDAAPLEIPPGWELRIVVVHTPLGPFPSYFLVPIELSGPLPDGVFISPINTGGGDPDGDTLLVNPVPVGPGPGPFEVETGIQCMCPYGLAVIGPTTLPVDEIRALDTVGAVHDAGAPVNFLVDPSGSFTLAPVGPTEGPIFEGDAEPVLFIP